MLISVITPSIRPLGLIDTQNSLAKQTFKDFEWLVEMGIPEKGHDLNSAYNRMLRRAKGELIVSLQDFITVEETYLQDYWDAYQKNPDTFFTNPVGKIQDTGIIFDWREHPEAVMDWNRWEIDSGAAPLAALMKIGGFDEALDEFWSSDNVSVGHRAKMYGFKFMNLPHIKAIAIDHDAIIDHPFRKNYNPDFNNERMGQIEREEIKIEL